MVVENQTKNWTLILIKAIKERRGDGGDGDDWGVFFLANERDYSSVVLVDKGGDDGGDG